MTLLSLDTRLLLLINHGAENKLFDAIMPFLSRHGYLLVLPFLLYLFGSASGARDDRGRTYLVRAGLVVLIACAAVFLAEQCEPVIKNAVGRIRPCRSIEGIRLVLPCPGSFSMPAGHALTSFAFAVPLYCFTARWCSAAARTYPLALASVIAFSRIYLGLHYPSDVAAGAFLGGLISLAVSLPYVAWMKRKERRR